MMRASIQVMATANAITVPSAAIRVTSEGIAITNEIAMTATTISAAKIASSGNSGVIWGSAGGEGRVGMSGSCGAFSGVSGTYGRPGRESSGTFRRAAAGNPQSDAQRLVGREVAGDAAVG